MCSAPIEAGYLGAVLHSLDIPMIRGVRRATDRMHDGVTVSVTTSARLGRVDVQQAI